jgi:hypothetical protein
MDLCRSFGKDDPLVFLATFRVVRVVLLWAKFILLEIQWLDAMGKLATDVLCKLHSAFVSGVRYITQ